MFYLFFNIEYVILLSNRRLTESELPTTAPLNQIQKQNIRLAWKFIMKATWHKAVPLPIRQSGQGCKASQHFNLIVRYA